MILNLKSQTDLSGFYVVYEGSTNIERKGIYGIAHFSEHLQCKAYEHLQNEFERKSILWNAYTSSNNIVFLFTGLDEYLAPYRDVVLNLMNGFIPTEQQFNDERRIIIEEYKDCFNSQNQAHALNLSRKLFNDFDPIGSLQDLESMTYQDMIDFMKIQYAAPSKIINVSKHSDYKSNIKFNKPSITKEVKYGNYDNILEIGNEYKDKSSIIISTPIIENYFNYISFITEMLSGGLQSPLYQEVREKRGLTYGIHCYISRLHDKAIAVIMAETSNDKVDEMIETIKMVIEDPNKYLTQERFDIVKEGMLIRKKKSEIKRYSNVGKFIEPKGWSTDDILDKLTLDKIKEVYSKYFDFSKMYVSNDKTEFLINEMI